MRLLFITFLSIGIQSISYSQSPSYKELTPLFNLIKSTDCSDEYLDNNEKELVEKLLDLNWNFGDSTIFEHLYKQTKNEKLDYRYYLILAKATNRNLRKVDYKNRNNSNNIINYYYKSLFLKLSVENCNSNFKMKDSLKLGYTDLYILSTLMDTCFPSLETFNDFALQKIRYCKELLNDMRLNFSKNQKSEMYSILGYALYETKFTVNSTEGNLSEIITLALKEDPKNKRALHLRAMFKQNDLQDHHAAIKDYIDLVNILELENKVGVENHNLWLKLNKLTPEDHKSIRGIRPTFERMFDLVDCYLSLKDFKSSLIWLDKSLLSIQQYRQYSRRSEYATDYEGLIHYFKAIAHLELNERLKACEDLEKAINLGYDIAECKKLKDELNCISIPIKND